MTHVTHSKTATVPVKLLNKRPWHLSVHFLNAPGASCIDPAFVKIFNYGYLPIFTKGLLQSELTSSYFVHAAKLVYRIKCMAREVIAYGPEH
jgi:hypothetical protein